ncbi:hypothetical protein Tco_0459334 [Tanacetum coccineum]
MGDVNPIHTLGDYSKPSLHEGYKNTIELPEGNNVVHLRSDTIRLVQNGCTFHGLRFEDPIQHVKDFLRIVDSIDLNGDTRNTTRLHLFYFSLHDKLSIGLIVYPRDPSRLGMISPLVSSHKKIIGILMEVEPLHEPQLEDLRLNTCDYDIPLSSREIPSIDEPEPQLLPNFSPLDVNLGDKRGTDLPIKPHSPYRFRMKVVDKSTINTPPSPHVASFHPKDTY